MTIRWHADDPVLFAEAIRYTAARTGFQPALIERDYFASVVLEYLAARHDGLAFKGGTALSKIHVGFYRLSEDLDFTIHMPLNASRTQRRREGDRLKALVADLPDSTPGLQVAEPMRGANQSTQYNASAAYRSVVDGSEQFVSIEIGLREPILTDTVQGAAQTIMRNPLTEGPLIAPWGIRCLSRDEAVAEKLRAALCRREIAIRDFFDVDYLVRRGGLNTADPSLLDLLRQKIAIPGTGPADISEERVTLLGPQLEGRLRPVLREQEFAEFRLSRAIEIVREVARRMRP